MYNYQEDFLTLQQPGKNYSASITFIYCKRVQSPIWKSPISEENSKLDKNTKITIFISVTGNLEMLGKGAIQKVVPSQI